MADLDEDTRARLREQGFDPDTDPSKLIERLSLELQMRCDERLVELWRVVYGPASMPGEPGFGPCSNRRRHFFTSIIGACMRYRWPWHEGRSDATIRRILSSGEGPRQLPIGLVLLDGGSDG